LDVCFAYNLPIPVSVHNPRVDSEEITESKSDL